MEGDDIQQSEGGQAEPCRDRATKQASTKFLKAWVAPDQPNHRLDEKKIDLSQMRIFCDGENEFTRPPVYLGSLSP